VIGERGATYLVTPLRDPEAGMAAVLLGLEKKLERRR
jgi:hypothetical protein